ncbi:MAG: tryptophan synthase subunit alpha [Leptospiraceae bacterium]|nr:tryptophan synthase subunit alpha [Leptospiraceae bacterium]
MSRLETYFQAKTKKSLFIPYFSLGAPSYETSVEWGKAILDGGANLLEIGIPFSDPIADGPVIQRSYKQALDNEPFSMEKIFLFIEKIHQYKREIPILILSYLNPIMSYGLENFFYRANSVGVYGIVIPDIPFDTPDYSKIYKITQKNEIDIINLVTPATTKERMKIMKKFSHGFIYYVTSYGVTGERKTLNDNLRSRIELVKKIFQIPVACGFGISTPEQAKEISEFAEGVIIGSAIQKLIEENFQDQKKCAEILREYVKNVRMQMH